MNIELTKQEAQQLIDLIDLAVKASGLQGAMAAVPLVIKLQQAAQEQSNG
jgi:hypothetical protein